MAFQIHLLTRIDDANPAGFDRYTYGVTSDSIVQITSNGYFPLSIFRGDLQNRILIDVMCNDGFFTLKFDMVNEAVIKANGNHQIVIHSGDQLGGALLSDAQYLLDGYIDVSDVNITVPAGGLNLTSYGNSIGGLTSTSDDHEIFVSGVGGSGNLFLSNMGISTTGNNSRVFNITDATGNNAVEQDTVNFYSCTDLGELTSYRQYLEENTARFGGTPELTFTGTMGGVRITTSLVLGIDNITALFKTGDGLIMSGRFISDLNCDLPAVGALFDFSETNFVNNESLILTGATITRQGVQVPNDTTIHPNIDQKSIKSLWRNNVGVRNTIKYVKCRVTTEVLTPLTVDNYAPLLGTWTQVTSSHIEMTSNGVWKRLTGAGELRFTGDIIIDGTQGDEIDIRVMVSDDDGVSFTREIEHLKRDIKNFAGSGSDVAFFPINFIGVVDVGELVRLEVENKTESRPVTMIIDSYLDISQV